MTRLAPAAIIETSTLLKVIAYSLLLGLGVAVVFGFGVTSAACLIDALLARRTVAVVVWGVLATACMTGVLAAIVLGLLAMTQK